MADREAELQYKTTRARAQYRFRMRLIISVVILGFSIIWGLYFLHVVNTRRDWSDVFMNTIVRQTQSIAEVIRVSHGEDIAEVKIRANNVNTRLIQNENILSENSYYDGQMPPVSADNMESDAFQRIIRTLSEHQRITNFTEQFYINEHLYNIVPQRAYIVDTGFSLETSVWTENPRNPHISRLLANWTPSVSSGQSDVWWLGLYIRGSEAIPYDRLIRGNAISGLLPNSTTEYFAGAPIYDRDGLLVTAALIIEYDSATSLLALRRNHIRSLQLHIAISLIYIAFALVIMRFLFFSLRRLVHNAVQIQKGDFNSKVFLKSNDELALIGDSMDRITEKIDGVLYDIKTIGSIQNSLFPQEYLDFLGKETVGELEIGEYTDRYVTTMSIQIHCPYISERPLSSSADSIELVNDIIQYISDNLDSDAGFIESITVHELQLFFTHNTDIAMETAMKIQNGVANWNAEREHNNKPHVSFNISLHRGTVSFGIVGESRFLKPYAISEAIETARQLARIAQKIGSPIIITENVSRSIIKSLNYQFRYLGSMLFGTAKSLQVMEEIDVYPDTLKRVIAATKIDFEEGVKNFERNYLKKARVIFETLSERIPDDKVVKYFQEHIEKRSTANRS